MRAPLVFLTGFGAFEDVEENASERLVQRLLAAPPAGIELAGRVLPVSFRRSADAIDAALAELAPRAPDVLLSMGVCPGGAFRLERVATTRLRDDRADNDGEPGSALGLAGAPLETIVDVAPLAALLERHGAGEVVVSEDAGGYVCERVYRHVLEAGRRLARPALFLHVPRLDVLSVERQLPPVRALVEHLASVVRARAARA